MLRLAIIVVVATVPQIAAADIRIAIRNDVWTELDPPIDDSGFTNDIDIHFWRPYRGYLVGGRLVHRWLTEVTAMPMGRRRDLVDLLATAARSWGGITPSLRIGPTLTGNIGGRYMQNGWHYLCRCGTLLEDGLQSEYEGSTDAGVLIGSRVDVSWGIPLVQTYAFADGQVSLGAGVSFVESGGGVRVTPAVGPNHFGAHVELAVMRFHVDDERLALPGGYRTGWQGAWRVGVHYARNRIRIDYEYRANESGSGEPIGVVAFTIKQAGTSF